MYGYIFIQIIHANLKVNDSGPRFLIDRTYVSILNYHPDSSSRNIGLYLLK